MSIVIKTPEDIAGMRVACRLASEVLDMLTPLIKPGVSTLELDKIATHYIQEVQGTISATIGYAPPGYPPFPAALCTSVNHVVCHGIPNDRSLLAAADLACQREVWDRCINTSERTKGVADFDQRFPTPFRAAVAARAAQIGLDPAYVYGLIRQESRFVMDARSGVGAAGLMQVMPATARWTAKKIGLTTYTADQITNHETNIAIGTGYLKLVLDDFDGSMPMAAAAYNAGPSRPRNWRNGPVMEAAIWAENVPFAETRDYVKKVLSNTTNYAAILTGAPQSLKARLGSVGPRLSPASAESRELP